MKETLLHLLKDALERDENNVKMEDKFRDYEEWDSLSVLSMLAAINEEYDIIIPRADFDKLEKVQDMYDYIIKDRGKNG